MVSPNTLLFTTIINAADTAVLSGVTFLVLIYLWYCKCRHEAAALTTAFALTALLTGLLKILFLTCSHVGVYFMPSGHVSLFAAVFGTCTLLASRHLTSTYRSVPIILFLLLIATISFSLIELGIHSPYEVGASILIGSLSTYIAKCVFLEKKTGSFDLRLLTLCILVPILLLHGTTLPVERGLHWVAGYTKSSTQGYFCTL